MKNQQNSAEKDLLNLKINTLTSENTRLAKEIENMKRSLEYSTAQLKEIAVKVIESSNSAKKISPQTQE